MSIELAAIAFAIIAVTTSTVSLRDGTTIPAPDWGNYAVPANVDYVAVIQIDVDGMQIRTTQITIKQSGHWHRETLMRAGNSIVTIADLRTGKSFRYSEPRRDRAPSLAIGGSSASNGTVLQLTGRLERTLGETCRVWNLKTRDTTKTFCLTADGIPLWYRRVVQGKTLDAAHTISVVRRHVGEVEAAPPKWALDLRTWGVQPEPTPRAKPNDRVLLTACPAAEHACTNTMEVRRLGGFSASSSVDSYGRSERYVGPLFSVSIDQTPSGKLRRLDIQPTSKRAKLFDPKPIKLSPTREMWYAGEQCAVLNRVIVPDAGRSECLSADGILLKSVFNGWTSRSLEAKIVTRGQTTMRDLLPPDDILRRE